MEVFSRDVIGLLSQTRVISSLSGVFSSSHHTAARCNLRPSAANLKCRCGSGLDEGGFEVEVFFGEFDVVSVVEDHVAGPHVDVAEAALDSARVSHPVAS